MKKIFVLNYSVEQAYAPFYGIIFICIVFKKIELLSNFYNNNYFLTEPLF
jgi:hypothetical protein